MPPITTATIVLIAATLLPTTPLAQTIYIYEDDQGVTHFTDRKPDTDREVTVQRAIAAPSNPLDMVNRGTGREPEWVFTNRLHGSLQIEVRLGEADNVLTVPDLPARFVLPALASDAPVMIGPLDPTEAWRYQIRSRAVVGRPDARPDTDYPYRPPFAPGQSFTIGQAFDGEFSHQESYSRHAVDITMPTGTPVHAARAGMVMDVARYFHGSGLDRERYGDRANFVRIEHDDGSMAVYAHLDYEGVEVRPGQRVRKGQRIGRSGATGFTTGPHLHFVIQKNAGMRLESIPFVFAGANGSARQPSRGERIRAAP